MVKIVHLATVASSHRYLLLPQLTALRDQGHEVIAISATGEDVQTLESAGIRHCALNGSTRGHNPIGDLRAAISLARILRRERPDVVHTHNPKPGIYGRIVARAVGVPVVVNTVHGLYATEDDGFVRRSIVYGLEAIAARFSDLELVQNIEDVDLMRRTRLAPNDRVRHLGNGIELTRFDPAISPDQRSSVRRQLGLDDEAVVVVSVGRLVEEKGLLELFEASGRAETRHELVIIGPHDPEKADSLSVESIDRARAAGTRFLGHRADVASLLPACDLFVLASHREGVPRAAMEAASCGLPIVATDIRGCRQVVDDGETGLLVPVGQPLALADAIDQLVSDPDRRARLGKAGRVKAEREFDEAEVVRRLLAVYAELGVE